MLRYVLALLLLVKFSYNASFIFYCLRVFFFIKLALFILIDLVFFDLAYVLY